MRPSDFTAYKDRMIHTVGQVIVGKDEVIRNVIICYLCGGHVLLEDLPGTGKTMLLRAFAAAVGGTFRRIQFTPDLMPSDLTGIHYFNQKEGDFVFRKGPLFGNLILADEINRATPRTQSSLLEAMEERQITVDGTTYPLEAPFMVMATQNPLESRGTFPLPEAQIDRFFMRLSLGYMDRRQELSVLRREPAVRLIEALEQAVTAEETAALQAQIPEVAVTEPVAGYLMDLITATRNAGGLICGVSTRGAIALYRAAQVLAAMNGREYVIPEDVQEMAVPVLSHRLTGGVTGAAEAENFIRNLLEQIPVPLETV